MGTAILKVISFYLVESVRIDSSLISGNIRMMRLRKTNNSLRFGEIFG